MSIATYIFSTGFSEIVTWQSIRFIFCKALLKAFLKLCTIQQKASTVSLDYSTVYFTPKCFFCHDNLPQPPSYHSKPIFLILMTTKGNILPDVLAALFHTCIPSRKKKVQQINKNTGLEQHGTIFLTRQEQEKQCTGYGLIWNTITDHGGNLRTIL